jgi:hypothetical protein
MRSSRRAGTVPLVFGNLDRDLAAQLIGTPPLPEARLV